MSRNNVGVNKTLIAQIALSAFLLFHLAAVFVLPNPDSIIYRETESLFLNYGNVLGINTTWRFFSPNPLIHMFEYEVVTAEGNEADAEGNVIKHRYPESVESAGSREGFNRRLNQVMFMMADPQHLNDFMAPYLCKQHPKATGLSFYSVSREFPTVETARTYESRRESLEKLKRRFIVNVDCHPPEATP